MNEIKADAIKFASLNHPNCERCEIEIKEFDNLWSEKLRNFREIQLFFC